MTATMSEGAGADAEDVPGAPGTGGARPRVGEPEPAPFLGPYLGLVSAVLCVLVGAFLLLAPFAFDYRNGAATVPRSSVVDLTTGGGVLLLGLLTAALFGAALVRRLRGPEPVRALATEPPELFAEAEGAGPEQEPAAYQEPEPEPEPEPAAPAIDPSGALRDLLTPLVAALAADLRARDNGSGLASDAGNERD
jgi:hypothetical protein